MNILSYLVLTIVLVALAYGGYMVTRIFNYNFGYETQVIDTVCSMVKPEYLKKDTCK